MKLFKKKAIAVIVTLSIVLTGGLFLSSNYLENASNKENVELSTSPNESIANDYDGKFNSEAKEFDAGTEQTDVILQKVSIDNIPKYSGNAYISINSGKPYFSESEKENKEPFEYYSSLDDLGRCGVAYANICKEIMPTEERGTIGQIRPSGWHTVKYNGIVDGNYLYNRCHLIGYQLAGENANELNLITGTRYLNIVGMLEFENLVGAYVEETNTHVLYRVTPIFNGNDLVAQGVEIEAWSVEDGGSGICFNVFCYNVQPGIEIDYATGDSWIAGDSYVEEKQSESSSVEESQTNLNEQELREFILNKNTKKFHLPTCSSVDSMAEKNKEIYEGTVDEIKGMGYTPCSRCLGMYK